MLDDRTWRLEVDLSAGGRLAGIRLAGAARELGRRLGRALGPDAVVVHGRRWVSVRVRTRSEVEAARECVASVLGDRDRDAAIRVERYGTRSHAWHRVDGPPRARSGSARPPSRPRTERDWTRLRRRAAAVGLTAGVGGTVWYALAPGVASYQALGLLVSPGLIVATVWIGRRLPGRVRWWVAVPLAPVGPIGYGLVGGSQWWAWGRLTVLPLVILLVVSGASDGAGHRRRARYGGFVDGPWGPP